MPKCWKCFSLLLFCIYCSLCLGSSEPSSAESHAMNLVTTLTSSNQTDAGQYDIYEISNQDQDQIFYKVFCALQFLSFKDFVHHNEFRFISPHAIDYVRFQETKRSSLTYCYFSTQGSVSPLVYVAKKTTKSEIQDIFDILIFFRLKQLETGNRPPTSLVLPECHFKFKEDAYTLYHAAPGMSLHDKFIKFQPPMCPTDILTTLQNIGSMLYRVHDYLRPTNREVQNFLQDPKKACFRFYVDSSHNHEPKMFLGFPKNISLARLLLSVNHGDLHAGNIFVNARRKIFFIDYSSMVRDLPNKKGFSSVTNDLAYFVACTFCYHRESYKNTLGRELFSDCMAHFLAGYLANIPEQYRKTILEYVFFYYCTLLEELMFEDDLTQNINNLELRKHFQNVFRTCIYPNVLEVINRKIKHTAQQKIIMAWRKYKDKRHHQVGTVGLTEKSRFAEK